MGSGNDARIGWRIHLLGELRAERNGTILNRFRTRRAASLLAYLALHINRFHSREVLISLLWPDAELDAGRARFRQELHALRQQLEPDGVPSGSVVLSNRFGVRLNPEAVQTDTQELERAVQHAAQGSPGDRIRILSSLVDGRRPGDLLPGFYEDWIIPERERMTVLTERAAQLFQEAQDMLAGGKVGQAFSLAQSDTTCEPIVRLPSLFTRFFGRDRELTELHQLLTTAPASRLITVTGPGGSGKTRLVLEMARRVLNTFSAGVVFIPLADITDPIRASLAVQQAFRLPPADAQTSIEEQVIGFLARRGPMLLVFDNLEHLLTTPKARASLTDFLFSLLERAPSVSMLVTSRRRLDMPGERLIVTSSLPIPTLESVNSEVAAAPSIALFVDRARSVRPDFAITERNASTVVELCRQLDGLPLALELAAARAATLSPAQMLTQLTERLGGRLDTFTRIEHNREQGHRHRSLRAAMQWSQELLPPTLQRVLARLSIFQGGWSSTIAGEVLEETEMEAALEELCASSLVRTVENDDGVLRFYMLETQREFAQEQLPAEERDRLMARLAHFYWDRLRTLRALYGIPTEPALLNFIQTEYENIRTALVWCHANDPTLGMALVVQLFVFWLMRGQYAEGVYWLDTFADAAVVKEGIASADNTVKTLYARILVSTGFYLSMMGRIEDARIRNQRAATLLEAMPERDMEAEEWLGWAYQGIGLYHSNRREHLLAKQWYEDSLACMRRTTETRNAGAALYRCAAATFGIGDLPGAETYLQEAFALLRDDDDYYQGYALALRATFAVKQEDYAAARHYFEESLLHVKRVSFAQYADIEMELASLEREIGNLKRAHEIGEAALQVFRTTGARLRAACILCHLARTALYAKSYDAAEAYAGEAARLFESLNDAAGSGTCSLLRGHCLLERHNDAEQAIRLIRRGLLALRHAPLTPDYLPYAFSLLAECAMRSGNAYQAVVYLGITTAIHHQQSGETRMLPVLNARCQRLTREAQHGLGGTQSFERAFADGLALSSNATFDSLTV